MKTTVDIVDPLLAEAKIIAAQEGTSVRALIEEGLRHVLSQRAGTGPFTLRDVSVEGRGLQAGVQEGAWQTLRDLAYEGRGA